MCDDDVITEPCPDVPSACYADWTCCGCPWLWCISLKHEITGTDTFVVEDVWLCRDSRAKCLPF